MKNIWEELKEYWEVVMGTATAMAGMTAFVITCTEARENPYLLMFFGGAILWTIGLWLGSRRLSKKDEKFDKKVKEEREKLLKTREIKEKAKKIFTRLVEKPIVYDVPSGKLLLIPVNDENTFDYNSVVDVIFCCANTKCNRAALIGDGKNLICKICKNIMEDTTIKDIKQDAMNYFRREVFRLANGK